MGAVFAYVIVMTILGPENKNRSMEARDDEDLVEAAGREAVETIVHGDVRRQQQGGPDDIEAVGRKE